MGVHRDDIEGELERGLSKVQRIDDEKTEVTDQMSPAIAHFYACGYVPERIAQLLLLDLEYVKLLLETETVQKEIEVARREVFSEDSRQEFRALSPRAARCINQIMESAVERGATKLQAATYIIDRAFGKPIQSHDVGGSLLKDFIQLLDAEKRGAIDIPAKQVKNVEDAPASLEAPKIELNDVDAWFQNKGE